MTARLVVLMGSGETAPTMVKTHRAVFERLGPDPVPAVLLDTPYGFQENADDISARAVEYFAQSVGRRVVPAELRRVDNSDPVKREEALSRVAAARWAFAGPGSPTYALAQWRGTEVPQLLADKLTRGGCVVFSSAAALTMGRYTVPVYEVYKVGAEPLWLDGLDLLAPVLGPDVAVIPHYDNAEGGNHDTRYCYLGERRLRILETQLPPRGWVLGVDEHTGVVFDLEAGSASVVGNGVVTLRRHGRQSVLPAGETMSISALVDIAVGKEGAPTSQAPAAPSRGAPARPGGPAGGNAGKASNPLYQDIRRLEADFDAAIAAREVDGAVRAILELDQVLVDWSGDTIQSDAPDRGRAALRRMVTRLGELARVGAREPKEVLGPYVEALLTERHEARAGRRFADADRIREALLAAGVEVRDTPDGTLWQPPPTL